MIINYEIFRLTIELFKKNFQETLRNWIGEIRYLPCKFSFSYFDNQLPMKTLKIDQSSSYYMYRT